MIANQWMRRLRHGFTALAAVVGVTGATAAEIKVGLLSQFSGAYSWWGQEYQRGVDLALAEVGGKVGGHTVTVLSRDESGINPPRIRQLTQELIVRDQVQYIVGGTFTPTVLAASSVINQSKIPYVIFNSGTSSVTKQSPYYVRLGFTQWAVCSALTSYARSKGAKEAVIVAADYAPGLDALDGYSKTFTAGGGKITGEIKVPVGTSDFTTYIQRVRELKPPYVFMFMPVGPMSAGFIKAFAESGLEKSGSVLLAGAETNEPDLPAIGDQALGLVSALHYGPNLDSPRNKAFVAAYNAKFGKDALPSFASVAAYDGIKLVFEMIKATNGVQDGDKAMATVKGYKWDSPRGPVSIDPKTREIVQNFYLRKVEKIGGQLLNKEFQTFPAVKDPWHELNP